MATTQHDQDALRDIRARIADAREERKSARHEHERTRHALESANGSGDIKTWPEFTAAQRARRRLDAAHATLENLQEEEQALLAGMGGGVSPGAGGGTDFLADATLRRTLEQVAVSENVKLGQIDLGQSSSREAIVERIGRFAAAGDTVLPSSTSRRAPHQGVVPLPQRQLRILDLIPAVPMDAGSSVPYLQEIAVANVAAPTAEGAMKPGQTVSFQDAEAKIETIPAFSKLLRQQMSDLPALEIAVRNRLERNVLMALEAQIVTGNGTGNNIRGFLNTTGLAVPDVSEFSNGMDAILEGIVDILVVGAVPNAALVSPRDWADMLRSKASGSGEYLSVGPFADAVERLWSAPTIPTPGVPAGKAIVGDFAYGATVLVREGINVRASDSDQDDFTRNRITLLAEGRFGLAIWSPASFALVDLSTISAP